MQVLLKTTSLNFLVRHTVLLPSVSGSTILHCALKDGLSRSVMCGVASPLWRRVLGSHKIAQRSLWSLHRSATKDDLSLAVFMCLKRTGSRFGNKSHYLENAMLTSYSLCGDAEFWIGCDGGSVEFKGLSFPWRNLPTASVHCLYASGPCFWF